MQNPRSSLVVIAALATLVFGGPAATAADKYPSFLSTQYQRYFARFVDDRTLPEQMLNAVGISSREYGRGFALIAGASNYPYMSGTGRELAPAGEDVRKLVNYLTTYEKFDEIVVLKDADVTEANLSFFLQRYFPRRLQEFPRSRFLFAYSGHGATVANKGYILTTEARDFADTFNSIPMITLRAMFQQVVDSGFHVLALINACYSGEFVRRSFGDTRFIPRYGGAHAITAGATNELTWHDGAVGSGSVFFEKLYAGLDGRAGRDGVVTVDDLAAYLRREVQISTDQQQNPLPGDLSRDGSRGGFFFFNRAPLVERGVLPTWNSAKGLPFGTEPGAANVPTTLRAGSDTKERHAALMSEAHSLLNNKDYDRALVAYGEALRIDHKDASAFNNRGNAYTGKKDYDRAISDFNEAIRLDPKLALAFYNRAFVYYEKKDYDRAISDYSQAIRLDPSDSSALFNRGVAYYGKKNYDRAISDYNQAILLDPRADAFTHRGNAYYAKKDYDRAISDFSQAIRLDPKHGRAFHSRGIAYSDKKEYERAISDYNEAIRLDPKHALTFSNRASVYYEKKDYDRAISDYSQAIRLDPTDAAAFEGRGLAKQMKGDRNGSATDIARARQLSKGTRD